MKLRKLFLGLSFILCGALGLHAASAFKVLSAAPKGVQNTQGRQAVTVHFNQPVVALGETSAFDSKTCPLTITPKIDGSCHYSGTQSLVFEPAENWPTATKFTVSVPKGFKSTVSGQQLAAAYQFSFTTPVPQVRSTIPYTGEHWLSLNPTLYVFTTQPVDLTRAAKFITLTTGAGKTVHHVPLSLRLPTAEELDKNYSYLSAEEQKSVFAVNPTETLQVGQKYTLSLLPGLPGKTGNAGMENEFKMTFFTFPPLTVQKVVSTGCLPFVPALYLSSPVRKHALYDSLEVVPAQAKLPLADNERDSLGYEFTDSKTGIAYFNMPLSFIRVAPHEKVEVTLKKGLRDIYGNTLAHDEHFTVSNDGYCPAVDFSADGFGVLESYLPARLPIALMNMPVLFMESARFNRDNFIPFNEQRTSYCAKRALEGATFTGDYTFPSVKDKTVRSYIDLARFFPTAKDSILFTQLITRRLDDGADCWVSSTDNITDVGITFKTSAQNTLLWTTSLKTGAPVGGLAVELRGADNKVVWTGTTDEHGLAIAPGWGQLEVPSRDWGQPVLYAFVSSAKGDGVVSNQWNDGLEPWRFNMEYDYNPTAQNYKTYLFTERGIYRPGETVHVKGVVRQRQGGAWKLPSTVRGKLTVHDSHGEEIFKKDVTLSAAWGTFDAQFELSQAANTGYWDVYFAPQSKGDKEPEGASTSFQVEAVKPADFNVLIKADRSSYLAGEEASFSAAAQYYFGAPLGMAKASWNLHQEPTWFTPTGYDKYTFTPYFLQQGDTRENAKLLLNASGELDSRGALLFAAKMPHVQLPVRVYAEVDIESPAHQHLFKRTSVMVHPADIYVGAKLLKDDYKQGDEVKVSVVAVTPDGKPAEATVMADIYKEEYYSVRKVGLAGRLEWVSERNEIPLPSQTLQVGKKGSTLSFVPQEAGSYYIKLTAKDLFGRTVHGGIDVYVQGESSSYGRRAEDDVLTLTPNKKGYKPGQTARIRVQSPYEQANALITVEREGILDAWTTTVKGGENTISVPLKDNYLPNVYVSVLLVQGRTAKPANAKEDLGKPQGKMGYVNLPVVPDEKRLVTTLKTNASKYQPGERVNVSLTTKAGGKGVPAEVVVMAVDEGVLALSNYQTPDLFAQFYGSTPISVFTMDNRAYVIGQRSFGEKGENRGGGGAASSKLGGTDMRSRFEFTPFYQAAVKTDAKGRAQVSFSLPDNLTTFRIMAVSLTQSEFGKAETTVKVSKPVMLTPSMPTFAREGDQFACGVILYNYEDAKGVFTVQASAIGQVDLVDATPQTVKVAKGSSREVMFSCRATKAGLATVAFAVKGKYSDGVQHELLVSTPEKAQTLAVYGATESAQTELTDQPGHLNPTADNHITVSAAASALLQLKGAISYLLAYPYNCLEQQLSKILPVVMAEPLIKDFKLADVQTLRKNAQEVLSRLGAYQHVSGGFGYWPDALPDPYVTAYALDIALQAKQAGFDVPTQTVEKAVQWLEGAFSQQSVHAHPYNSTQTEAARAYSVYVLTRYGKNTDSIFNTLYAKRLNLPQSAVAYLLQAAVVGGRTQKVKETLAEQLINKLVYTPTAAYVDGGELPWLHENNTTATAHTLQALLAAKMSPKNDYQLATWLVSQLNAQGNWNDTFTNATVLRALTTYYATREGETPRFTATVKQADEVVLSGTFNGHPSHTQTVNLPFAQVYAQGSETRFSFAKQGTGTLYYTLAQTYTPASYDRPVEAGFGITRTLSTLDGKPVTTILTGERYKVTLHIKTASAKTFVAVSDFIPAGFGLVNTTLATESATQAELLAADNTVFTRTEQYEDCVYGFADEVPAGEHTFSYLVTALSAGTYTYPAAWVSQMYAPEVFGRNTTSTLVIK